MDSVVFQGLDWNESHDSEVVEVQEIFTDEEGAQHETTRKVQKHRLKVVVYGRAVDGRVVRATLENFRPSLLICASKVKAQSIVDLAELGDDVEIASARLKDFMGFSTEGKKFAVLRFNSTMEFTSARRKLKDLGVPLYNCRMQPFMQLVHRAGVSPSGWMSVPVPRSLSSNKFVDVMCDWTHLTPAVSPEPMAPFVVTAFDIECYSASGDFPAARKTYNRLARDIVRFIDERVQEPDLGQQLEDAVLAAFNGDATADAPIARLELRDGQRAPSRNQLRQCLLSDIQESMRNVKWLSRPVSSRVSEIAAKMDCLTERGQREALVAAAEACGNAVARSLTTRSGDPVADGVAAGKSAAPFASAPIVTDLAQAALSGAQSAMTASQYADDLSEQVVNKACRYARSNAESAEMPWRKSAAPLPLLKGDPVIQVGLTTRRGRDGDMAKRILVLDGCSDIPGVVVEIYADETSLLRATVAAFRSIDPDFVTGYNIMGFDFMYMYERALELGILGDMEFGRRGEHDPPVERSRYNPVFVEKRLASAAYGDNMLRFFDMPGRVVFDLMKVVQREHNLASYKLDDVARHFTGDCKEGLSPADIFRKHVGTDDDRAAVASYCVQDCALCSDLLVKLNTLPNAIGMADVCSVPPAWIFLRGQGCKILSLVARQCRADGFAMPEMRNPNAEGYDGAFVLPPRIGVYIETPVAVLDFSSLYPSSMISTNLSHDTMILDDSAPDPPGCKVEAVTFMLYRNGGRDSREVTRRFVQPGGAGREGVLPRILKGLLAQRSAVRKKIPHEPDAFTRSVMNGLQLAFKVTANSLYGQMGSATSDVCCVDIAASTTAVGRSMLIKLRDFVFAQNGDVIYGDTDSCFMTFPKVCAGLSGLPAVQGTIDEAMRISAEFRQYLPPPQDAEYEKTFWPMILISKKRYVGNLYEADAYAKPKQKSMGLVLTRRDNAPVVKRVYKGVIDRILDTGDVAGAAEFVRKIMDDLVNGRIDMAELVVSKSLSSYYANPDQIAHAVLAKRMAERDPGSAPSSGERVPYVYVTPVKGEFPAGTLQGGRIEHPAHVHEFPELKIDYAHYVTNQVMKPIAQLFALMVERLPGCRLTQEKIESEMTAATNAADGDAVKARKKVDVLKQNEVIRLLFQESLDVVKRQKSGMPDIRTLLGP